jgi:hypothetical protein
VSSNTVSSTGITGVVSAGWPGFTAGRQLKQPKAGVGASSRRPPQGRKRQIGGVAARIRLFHPAAVQVSGAAQEHLGAETTHNGLPHRATITADGAKGTNTGAEERGRRWCRA